VNLATMRTRVRNAIKDLDSNSYYFTDAEVDSAIGRALNDFACETAPAAIAYLSGDGTSTRLTVTGVSDYLYTLAVEYPLDRTPAALLRFNERPIGSLLLLIAPPAAGSNNVRVWYARSLSVAADPWLVQVNDEGVVEAGAAYYLALAGARFASVRLNSSQGAPRNLEAVAKRWERVYEQRLRAASQRVEYPERMPAWSEA
jgi:hypothetical protein